VREARKRQGGESMVVEPLFPRYLFIYLDTTPITGGRSVPPSALRHWCALARSRARIPDELVDFLKAREGEAGCMNGRSRITVPATGAGGGGCIPGV